VPRRTGDTIIARRRRPAAASGKCPLTDRALPFVAAPRDRRQFDASSGGSRGRWRPLRLRAERGRPSTGLLFIAPRPAEPFGVSPGRGRRAGRSIPRPGQFETIVPPSTSSLRPGAGCPGRAPKIEARRVPDCGACPSGTVVTDPASFSIRPAPHSTIKFATHAYRKSSLAHTPYYRRFLRRMHASDCVRWKHDQGWIGRPRRRFPCEPTEHLPPVAGGLCGRSS